MASMPKRTRSALMATLLWGLRERNASRLHKEVNRESAELDLWEEMHNIAFKIREEYLGSMARKHANDL